MKAFARFLCILSLTAFCAACGGGGGGDLGGGGGGGEPAPVNQPPSAHNSTVSAFQNSPIALFLYGTDPDDDALSYLITSSLLNGSLSGFPPHVTYTPNLSFIGADTLTFSVNDGTVDSPAATASITVSAPIASAQAITRISVDSDGIEGNGVSGGHIIGPTHDGLLGPAISFDGRYVVFHSKSTNLVASDINGVTDVFLHDRTNNQTTRVSLQPDGSEFTEQSFDPSLSHDGSIITFNTLSNYWLNDLNAGIVSSPGDLIDASGSRLVLSDNGIYAVFPAINVSLVPNDTNGWGDIFSLNIVSGTISRLSITSAGVEAVGGGSSNPVVSPDGRFVAFASASPTLAPNSPTGGLNLFLHDRDVSQNSVYDEAGDINTFQINVASDGTPGNNGLISGLFGGMDISRDGRFIVFASDATNLVAADTNQRWDVFLHDRILRTTIRISDQFTSTHSTQPSISADGRFVAYVNGAEFCCGDVIYVHDRDSDGNGIFDEAMGTSFVQVDLDSAGTPANGASDHPEISKNGHYIAFTSEATNLVTDDLNGTRDVFIAPNPLLP